MLNGFAGLRLAKSIVLVIMALLASLVLFAGLQLPRLEASIERLSHANSVQRELAYLSDDASDIETGGRGFLLTADAAYLEPYHSGIADAGRRVRQLESILSEDVESTRRLQVASQILNQKIEVVTDYVQRASAGDRTGALDVVREGRGKLLMDRFRTEVRGLAVRWQGLHEQIEYDVASRERTVVISVSSVALLALLLIMFAWEAFRRHAGALDDARRQSGDILDSLAEGVVKQTADGKVVAANARAAEILGLTSAQLMGRDSCDPRWAAVRDDGAECSAEEHPAMVALRTGEEIRGVVMGVVKPSGDRAWLLINALPMGREPSGRAATVVTSFLDITPLREEHRARIESEARMRALFDHVPDAIIVRDAQGTILEANRSATAVWGYTHEELLRMNVTDIGHDMSLTDARRVVEAAMPGQAMSLARVHRRKDGTLIATETSLTAIVERGERRILAVVRDVTRQREAELALVQSEERLQAILSHLPAPIAYFDESRECRYANPAMAEWCAGRPGASDSRHLPDLSCIRTDAQAAHAYDLVTSGHVARFDWVGPDASAEHRYATVTLIPEAGDAGRRGFFCLVTDTTELTRKVMARTEALSNAMEALRDALAARDEFLQNASHEMRTPLHAISSFAELAARRYQSQGEPDERLARYLDNIRDATGRLSRFIDDILELVRLQSDRGVAHAETLDLRRSIEAAAAGVESQLSGGRMTLETEIATAASEIRADPRMLEVLLRNLLSNAIKFSRAGCEIRVSVGDAVVSARDQVPVPGVLITVADEGVGIPEAELEQIFEKFQQSSRTRTGAGGTGLGLSICRAIVARHGGTITARNIPGGGAAFDVALPRIPTPAGTLEKNGDMMPAGREGI